MIARIHALLELDTAGDPISGVKWTRKTTRKLSEELGKAGIAVSRTTVARLLRKLDDRLRVNHKNVGQSGKRNRRLLAGEELRTLAACEAHAGPIPVAAVVILALATAMRRGELASMRWEHLDRSPGAPSA